jgi:hypothetical protein
MKVKKKMKGQYPIREDECPISNIQCPMMKGKSRKKMKGQSTDYTDYADGLK